MDAEIVGKTIRLTEFQSPVTIVGMVSPELALPKDADLWTNARVPPTDQAHFLSGLVRLRPGGTIDQLRAAAEAAMQELARVVPNAIGREYVVQPLVSSIVGDLAPVLPIVLGATALLQVMASVNVTNLLLARHGADPRDGAARRHRRQPRPRRPPAADRIDGRGGHRHDRGPALRRRRGSPATVLGASRLSRLEAVPVDGRVMPFAFAVLLFSGLAMGIAPAWQVSRTGIKALLNAGSRSVAHRPPRRRSTVSS